MMVYPNPFEGNNRERLIVPAEATFKIVPSDSDDLPNGVCRALLVGSGGAADMIDASGNLCEAFPLQTGYNPIGASRIKSTNLTADNIWALY
jgi:hypothetical protein